MSFQQSSASTWNGRMWVPSKDNVITNNSVSNFSSSKTQLQSNSSFNSHTTSNFAQHGQTFQSTMSIPVAERMKNENPVEQYSRYYQYWKEQQTLKKKEAALLPPGSRRDELLRVAYWAEYYATQSAHAAHYYNNTISKVQPTPLVKKNDSNRDEKYQKTLASITSKDELPSDRISVSKCVIGRCTGNKSNGNIDKYTNELSESSLNANSTSSPNILKSHIKSQSRLNSVSIEKKSTTKNEKLSISHKTNNDYGYYGRCNNDGDKDWKRNNILEVKSSEEDFESNFGRKKQKLNAEESAPKRKVIAKTIKNSPSPHNKNGFERSSRVLAKRADRFSDTLRKSDSKVSDSDKKVNSMAPDMRQYMGLDIIGGKRIKGAIAKIDFEQMVVKGCCQKLEKNYLRLTQPPRPELVRPQNILARHMENIKGRWINKEIDYVWFCSQLKAVRQDLTVQRINNEFSIDVYETHARVALEEGDINEYNQCQTQLIELYDLLGCGRHDTSNGKTFLSGLQNQNEFIAYRIIYYVFLTGNKKYEGGSTDLFKIMLSLNKNQKQDPSIKHALQVRVAVAEQDYHTFFQLLDECPKMGAYLMDYIAPSMRFSALDRICKAYRPSIPTNFVLSELGFDINSSSDVESGLKWIQSLGGVLNQNKEHVLTKESVVMQPSLKEKKSLI